MQNSERQPFEESWRSAFDGAEMSTSDSVWTSIEMKLVSGEARQMKRRVVFYQRLAAATVIFALLSGSIAVYNYREGNEIATTTSGAAAPKSKTVQPQQSTGSSSAVPSPNVPARSGTSDSHVSRPSDVRKASKSNDNTASNGTTDPLSTVPPAIALSEDTQVTDAEAARSKEETVIVSNRAVKGDSVAEQKQRQVAEAGVKEMLSPEQFNAILKDKDNADTKLAEKEEFVHAPWLGVGGAAGSYNPNPSVGGGMAQADYADSYSSLAQSMNVPQSVRDHVGSAYSAGVSAGLKLSRRWIVQTGINFVSQQIDYTTNFVGVSASNKATPMTPDFMYSSDVEGVMMTTSYAVSSHTQILSVPVQTGFVIVDRKFGWQLNTGVSTDFFLQSTLEDKSGGMEKISEGSGEDSPFRAVNWSGLLNTELSYQIGDHYRLAVVPGMRYMFKPMLKDDTGSPPLIVDLGFRVNYLFN